MKTLQAKTTTAMNKARYLCCQIPDCKGLSERDSKKNERFCAEHRCSIVDGGQAATNKPLGWIDVEKRAKPFCLQHLNESRETFAGGALAFISSCTPEDRAVTKIELDKWHDDLASGLELAPWNPDNKTGWNATSENDLKVARYETLANCARALASEVASFRHPKPDGKRVVNQDGDPSNKIAALEALAKRTQDRIDWLRGEAKALGLPDDVMLWQLMAVHILYSASFDATQCDAFKNALKASRETLLENAKIIRKAGLSVAERRESLVVETTIAEPKKAAPKFHEMTVMERKLLSALVGFTTERILASRKMLLKKVKKKSHTHCDKAMKNFKTWDFARYVQGSEGEKGFEATRDAIDCVAEADLRPE